MGLEGFFRKRDVPQAPPKWDTDYRPLIENTNDLNRVASTLPGFKSLMNSYLQIRYTQNDGYGAGIRNDGDVLDTAFGAMVGLLHQDGYSFKEKHLKELLERAVNQP